MTDKQTDLRDRIAAAIWERQNPGRRWGDCEYRWRADAEADADAVLAVLPEFAEAHRLALSEALGLGTGAPWDAIHDRATELGLPPLAEDPVAQRLGLVPAPVDRAAVLLEAATAAEQMRIAEQYVHHSKLCDAWDDGREAVVRLLRRLAGNAGPKLANSSPPPRNASSPGVTPDRCAPSSSNAH